MLFKFHCNCNFNCIHYTLIVLIRFLLNVSNILAPSQLLVLLLHRLWTLPEFVDFNWVPDGTAGAVLPGGATGATGLLGCGSQTSSSLAGTTDCWGGACSASSRLGCETPASRGLLDSSSRSPWTTPTAPASYLFRSCRAVPPPSRNLLWYPFLSWPRLLVSRRYFSAA